MVFRNGGVLSAFKTFGLLFEKIVEWRCGKHGGDSSPEASGSE
jgi:hypothetical protein